MNSQHRMVARVIEPEYVMEGAGVKLRRSIATHTLNYLDPFLLFDHFGSANPEDYIKGFPWHPHRGIETVTYIISGVTNHHDSIGNSGSITAGDVQWMTAGGGIMHEEMPQRTEGELKGFQLWVNLPAKLKMTRPRYQDVLSKTIPEVHRDDGVTIRVIAGEVGEVQGVVTEIYADPMYLDITVPPNGSFSQSVMHGHNAFAYVFEGIGIFGGDAISHPKLVVFGDGDLVEVRTQETPIRFLLVSGKPLNEPIARYGPFVMNTRQEIEQALEDLRNGTFVKSERTNLM